MNSLHHRGFAKVARIEDVTPFRKPVVALRSTRVDNALRLRLRATGCAGLKRWTDPRSRTGVCRAEVTLKRAREVYAYRYQIVQAPHGTPLDNELDTYPRPPAKGAEAISVFANRCMTGWHKWVGPTRLHRLRFRRSRLKAGIQRPRDESVLPTAIIGGRFYPELTYAGLMNAASDFGLPHGIPFFKSHLMFDNTLTAPVYVALMQVDGRLGWYRRMYRAAIQFNGVEVPNAFNPART